MRALAVIAILSFVVPLWLSQSSASADHPTPNIVFILIDDLAYADCGFNGGKEIKTPNIDKLAKSGAVLESHYVQPVCSPTRAAFLTGRYPTRTGVYTVVRPHAKWGLPLQERTLANALKDAGYTTAIVGKWHLGEFDPAYYPRARGFDHQHGHFFGAIDNYTHMRDGSHDWYHNDAELREEGYSTHLLTKESCRLIKSQEKSKPLFLYVPYNAVHTPLQVPEKYLEPYSHLTGPRKQLAGMLAAVDEGIGEIVRALDESGMRDNTLIVFSADNGGPKPGENGPLKGYKGSVDEGGVRGCAFATWPGKIPAGQRIQEPVHVIDWYPTLVKLAKGTLDQKLPLDGKDIWPVLTLQARTPHEAILCAQSPNRVAIRMGDWKLVQVSAKEDESKAKKVKKKNEAASSERLELYNLASDIGETKNLATSEPERVALMRSRLNAMLKDAVPLGEPIQQ
jgi:arylsulfatase A-like enzyme